LRGECRRDGGGKQMNRSHHALPFEA